MYIWKLLMLKIIMFINLYNHVPYMYYLYHNHLLAKIVYVISILYILALVEPS